MNLLCRIKELCETKNISIARLEQETGLANGSIRKWEKVLPSSDRLEKVADYFNVTTDYLLGRSASCIIDDKLIEKNMTLDELSEKSGVSLHWLKNLDSFIPGAFGYDHEVGYEWITKVAEVLELPDKRLRAALARQEIPAYDGPISNVKEDFAEPYNIESSNKIKVEDVNIRAIARAEKKLTSAQTEQLRKYAEYMFPDAFKDDNKKA